ncbi:hypothetical protein [Brevibacillus parabrevis]|nr:hypothetical protein [Brevibacillus parabrevis]
MVMRKPRLFLLKNFWKTVPNKLRQNERAKPAIPRNRENQTSPATEWT